MNSLRNSGIKCETDFLNRSVKSQMKEANKCNARYAVVIGENELKNNSFQLKKMSDGNEISITNFENLIEYLKNENQTSSS